MAGPGGAGAAPLQCILSLTASAGPEHAQEVSCLGMGSAGLQQVAHLLGQPSQAAGELWPGPCSW